MFLLYVVLRRQYCVRQVNIFKDAEREILRCRGSHCSLDVHVNFQAISLWGETLSWCLGHNMAPKYVYCVLSVFIYLFVYLVIGLKQTRRNCWTAVY